MTLPMESTFYMVCYLNKEYNNVFSQKQNYFFLLFLKILQRQMHKRFKDTYIVNKNIPTNYNKSS